MTSKDKLVRLFFLSYDSAFYWDRTNTLFTHAAQSTGIKAAALFQQRFIHPDSILVFNRIAHNRYFRFVARLCWLLKIPYLVDVDDLFWELPGFSQDWAVANEPYLRYLDRLISKALIVTTTTGHLRSRLVERYPGINVRIIDNCPPALKAPAGAVLIANTDNFKLERHQVGWFTELLDELHRQGVALQLIGDNRTLLESPIELKCHVIPTVPLTEYLRLLAEGGYAAGLVPVSQGSYSDCKSAIKLMELAGCGIPVLASDILPYRNFKRDFPECDLCLVDNTKEAWQGVISQVVKKIPASQLAAGQRRNRMLFEVRACQLKQWQELAESLRSMPACAWRMVMLDFTLRLYEIGRGLAALAQRPIRPFARLVNRIRRS